MVPAKNLYRVPDEVDLESAALTEPLACTVHGVLSVAKVQAGDNVAITGPGPIGLLALQLAKGAGATVVLLGTAVDHARLDLAKQLGADHTLDATGVSDLPTLVQDLLHAEGADLVIECSGAGPAADALLRLVRRGGRFCQMGLFGQPVCWNHDLVCYKELTVTGTNASVPSAWPRALKLMAEGRVKVRRLVTHRFSLRGQFAGQPQRDAVPGLEAALTKEPHRWIPHGGLALRQPAKVWGRGDQRPHRLGHGAGQVSDGSIHGNDHVQVGDERGRVYSGTNLRTRGSWQLPDAQHMCGGA